MSSAQQGSRSPAHGLRGIGTFLVPRLEDVLFVAIFLLVVALGPRLLNVDGDLGRHLTIGEHILQTGRIPTTDVFSHTMSGEELTPHEWLAQVAFALAYRILGLDGVVLLCAVVLGLTLSWTYRSGARRSGLGLATLMLALVAASASSLHWLARPHLFTLLLVVAWTDGLERSARGEPAGLVAPAADHASVGQLARSVCLRVCRMACIRRRLGLAQVEVGTG